MFEHSDNWSDTDNGQKMSGIQVQFQTLHINWSNQSVNKSNAEL